MVLSKWLKEFWNKNGLPAIYFKGLSANPGFMHEPRVHLRTHLTPPEEHQQRNHRQPGQQALNRRGDGQRHMLHHHRRTD